MKYPAIIDLKTKKISNCSPNSKDYMHEMAHLKFSESSKGPFIQWLGEISQFYTICSIATSFFVPIFRYISLIGILIMIFCFTFEELTCTK